MTAPTPLLTLAVLTGGGSRRMGADKALLDAGGVRLARRPIDALRGRIAEVLLVGRAVAGVEGRVVGDVVPGEGPLAGVVAALAAAHSDVAVVGCDMPTVVPELVDLLVARLHAGKALAAACLRDGRMEPLPAVLRREAAAPLAEALRTGTRALGEALAALGPVGVPESAWRSVDPTGLSFENWNTPADVRPL